MAILALDAYGNLEEALPPGWEKICEEELEKLDIQSTFQVPQVISNINVPMENYNLSWQDYRVAVFRYAKDEYYDTDLIALAIRGTAPTPLSAFLKNVLNDDIALTLNIVPTLYGFAADIATKLRRVYPVARLVHTGHSLGAAVASLIAGAHGETAIVFDSPGVQGIVDKNAALSQAFDMHQADITIYQSRPNLVNNSGTPLRIAKEKRLMLLPELEKKLDSLENKSLVKSQARRFFNLLSLTTRYITWIEQAHAITKHLLLSHSLANIVAALKHSCLEQYTVATGDWLSTISQKKYGKIEEWPIIHKHNQFIADPHVILPNTTITIPYPEPNGQLLGLTTDELFKAIECEDLNRVEVCLSQLDTEVRDQQGWTPLIQAILQFDYDTPNFIIEKLIQHNANVNAFIINDNQQTFILDKLEEVHRGRIEYSQLVVKMIKLLLEKGANFDACKNISVKFAYAIIASQFERVKELIRDVDINNTNAFGYTPLYIAVIAKQSDIVKLLIEHNASTAVRPSSQNTLLHIAAANGDIETIQLLLQKNIDVDVDNAGKEKPLHCAAKYNQTFAIECLLNAGATIDATTRQGKTALTTAVEQGHYESTHLLLQRNASPAILDASGQSLLSLGVHKHPRVVQLLIQHKASVNMHGSGLLQTAAGYGYPESIRYLIEAKANPNDIGEGRRRYPLMVAVDMGNSEAAEILLNNGADVELGEIRERNISPLFSAFHSRNKRVIKVLLDHSADVNAVDGNNESLLHKTVHDNYFYGIKLLLEKNALVNHPGLGNRTPLHIACYQEFGNLTLFQTFYRYRPIGKHIVLLLASQADPLLRTQEGKNAIQLANEKNINLLHWLMDASFTNMEDLPHISGKKHSTPFPTYRELTTSLNQSPFNNQQSVHSVLNSWERPLALLESDQQIAMQAIIVNTLVTTTQHCHALPKIAFDLQLIANIGAYLPQASLSTDMVTPLSQHIQDTLAHYGNLANKFSDLTQLFDGTTATQVTSLQQQFTHIGEAFSTGNFFNIPQQMQDVLGSIQEISKLPNKAIDLTNQLLGQLNNQVQSAPDVIPKGSPLSLQSIDGYNQCFEFVGMIVGLGGNTKLASQIVTIGKSAVSMVSTILNFTTIAAASGPLFPFVAIGGALSSLLGAIFGGGPSAEQQMLEQISQQIGKLAEHLDQRFDRLEGIINSRFARVEEIINKRFDRVEDMLKSLHKQISLQFKEALQQLADIKHLLYLTNERIKELEHKLDARFRELKEDNYTYVLGRIKGLSSQYYTNPAGMSNEAASYATDLVIWSTRFARGAMLSGDRCITSLTKLWEGINQDGIVYHINAMASYAASLNVGIQSPAKPLANPWFWANTIKAYQALLKTPQLVITWDCQKHFDRMSKPGHALQQFILAVKRNKRLFEILAENYQQSLQNAIDIFQQDDIKIDSPAMVLALEQIDVTLGIWSSFLYLAFNKHFQQANLANPSTQLTLWSKADFIRYLRTDSPLIIGDNRKLMLAGIKEHAFDLFRQTVVQQQDLFKNDEGHIYELVDHTLKELTALKRVFIPQRPMNNSAGIGNRYSYWSHAQTETREIGQLTQSVNMTSTPDAFFLHDTNKRCCIS